MVALGAAVLLVGSVGVSASTGAGARPWLLGGVNRSQHTTALVSDAGLDKATVKIRNKGDGPALSLVTDGTRPPLAVTSSAKVNLLNADRLDGLDSSQLVRSDQDVDADTLDGQDSAAFAKVPEHPLTVSAVGTQPVSLSLDSLGSFNGVAVTTYDPSSMFFPWNGLNLKAPRDGTYLVSATVQWAANDAGARTLWITKEAGATVTRMTGPPAEASTPTVQTVSGIVHLAQGKFVTVFVRQTGSGGPLDVSLTTFDMAYVGT
jgi:hypothetical protein